MKKRIGMLLIAVMLLQCILPVFAAEGDIVQVYINNEPVSLPQPAVIQNSTALVPARPVLENLGCEVTWVENGQSIVITKDDLYLAMFLGRTDVYNAAGEKFELSTPPVLMNDSSMIPVRFISEMLHMDVQWDDVTKSVFINSPEAYATIGSTDAYRRATFQRVLDNLWNYSQQGLFFEAKAILDSYTPEQLEQLAQYAGDLLPGYYVMADYINQNIDLMRQGQPNLLERERSRAWEKINTANRYCDEGLYFEAGNVISDIYSFNLDESLTNAAAALRSRIETGIANIPVEELNRIRRQYEAGYLYEAHAAAETYLGRGDLSADLRTQAEALLVEIAQAITNYENSRLVRGVLYVTNVASGVNFRSDASTKSDIIGIVPFANAVGFIETAANNYVYVEYKGQLGYISRDYLTDTKPATSVSVLRYVVDVRESLPLRDVPGTVGSTIVNIPVGSAVGFIENASSQYTRVEYNGHYGYVDRRYLALERR